MPKRKITVTVDGDLVDLAHQLGGDTALSAVVNDALAEHVERLGRLAALKQQLDEWDEKYGPASPEFAADAKAAFDEADGLAEVAVNPARGAIQERA